MRGEHLEESPASAIQFQFVWGTQNPRTQRLPNSKFMSPKASPVLQANFSDLTGSHDVLNISIPCMVEEDVK